MKGQNMRLADGRHVRYDGFRRSGGGDVEEVGNGDCDLNGADDDCYCVLAALGNRARCYHAYVSSFTLPRILELWW